jgi:carbonic anhydrase
MIGPQTWNNANSKYQSPINIETSETLYDENLANNPLIISYDDKSCFRLKNTGHTFQVDGSPTNISSYNH